MSKLLYAFAVVLSCLVAAGVVTVSWALFAVLAAVAGGLFLDRY